MPLEILVLQGIPGSGKTTFARGLLSLDSTYVRVSRDDIRNMLGKYWVPAREKLVSTIEVTMVNRALTSGYNVIIDATNLNPTTIAKWKSYEDKELVVTFKLIDTPLEECILRDSKRENPVGEKVIRDFYRKYCEKTEAKVSDFKVEKVLQKSYFPKAIICDLDGTLCLHNNRSPYDEEKCDTDICNVPVANLLTNLYTLNKTTVIYVSGRTEKVHTKTIQWLKKNHLIFDNAQLYMRKIGDTRDDRIVKKEIFEKHIFPHYYTQFVLDDRNKVVKMWRDLGLTCLQVAEGNF